MRRFSRRLPQPLWPSVQVPSFKAILMAVVKYLEQPEVFIGDAHAQLVKVASSLFGLSPPRQMAMPWLAHSLRQTCGVDGDVLQTLFTGLLLVVRAGIRSRHKPAELKQDLEEVRSHATWNRHALCSLHARVCVCTLAGAKDARRVVCTSRQCHSGPP